MRSPLSRYGTPQPMRRRNRDRGGPTTIAWRASKRQAMPRSGGGRCAPRCVRTQWRKERLPCWTRPLAVFGTPPCSRCPFLSKRLPRSRDHQPRLLAMRHRYPRCRTPHAVASSLWHLWSTQTSQSEMRP
eukprot:3748454-Prymnesium_polylepis.2